MLSRSLERYYVDDYRKKILEVFIRGAVGVVFGEHYPGKIGSFLSGIWTEQLPVCVLHTTYFEQLLDRTSWLLEDPPAVKDGFNFENAFLFTKADDEANIPIPHITKVCCNLSSAAFVFREVYPFGTHLVVVLVTVLLS